MEQSVNNSKIAVIGLGYVGLPLAVEFSRLFPVIGFDINSNRVKELNKGIDNTLEVDNNLLSKVVKEKNTVQEGYRNGLYCSNNAKDIKDCNVFIITVPTPTDEHNKPDLTPLKMSSEAIGKILKLNDVVIYESTVYPGVTEEVCVPILENVSGLKYNSDFYCGYSPERINPGDKEHTITNIKKVTSGSTLEAADFVDQLYGTIITAGTHKATSIKVAEASKVIENSQRDINIAFVNELAKIFNLLEIDTNEVLEAAGTKWNFLPFKPGLVGGHCIGVDPYYLAQKAQEVGYHPEIILAGRRLNDGMGSYVASEIIKLMIRKDIKIKGSKALVLGITFKENCPDIRNTRAIDIINELSSYGMEVDVLDPWAKKEEVKFEYGVDLKTDISEIDKTYNAIVLAVSHQEFVTLNMNNFRNSSSIIYDVKGILSKDLVEGRL